MQTTLNDLKWGEAAGKFSSSEWTVFSGGELALLVLGHGFGRTLICALRVRRRGWTLFELGNDLAQRLKAACQHLQGHLIWVIRHFRYEFQAIENADGLRSSVT